MTDPLGVKPSFDTSDFKTGISQMNQALRVLDSGFKANAAALGDWTKSATGLELRAKSLGGQIDIQRQKVGALTAEHARLATAQGADSRAATEMQIRVNNATAALNKMELELEQNGQALNEVKNNSQKATTSVQGLGTAAETSARRTINLKGALGGVVTGLKATAAAAAAALAAIGLIAGAMAGLAVSTIGPASDLNETISKVGVVFEQNAPSIRKLGETAAASLGMSENAALSAAATYGNLFRSMGFTSTASSVMSIKLVELASDLASFNNIGTDEALEKLRAGLTGETEPLKSLGINMNEAALKAKALSLGLIPASDDTTKLAMAALQAEKAQASYNEALRKYGANSIQAREASLKLQAATEKADEAGNASVTVLTAQQKAQAAYAIIMEQTALAQGDFARTSGGLANQQRIFTAKLEDSRARMGNAFLPVVTEVTKAVNKLFDSQIVQQGIDNLVSGIGKIGEAFTPLLEAIGDFDGDFKKVTDAAIGTLDKLFPNLRGQIDGIIQKAREMAPVFAGVLAAIGAAVLAFVYTTLIPAAIASATALAPVIAGMLPIIAIVAGIGLAVGLLAAAWQNNWGGIRENTAAVWAAIQPVLAGIAQWFGTNIPAAISTVSAFWTNTLFPAIKKVKDYLDTNIFPLLKALADFLKTVWGKNLEIVAALWNNVLYPALVKAGDEIATKLKPIMEDFSNFIETNVTPVLESLDKLVSEKIAGGFAWLGEKIQGVIGWLNDMIALISGVTLPDWMTNGGGNGNGNGGGITPQDLRPTGGLFGPSLRRGLSLALASAALTGGGLGTGRGAGSVNNDNSLQLRAQQIIFQGPQTPGTVAAAARQKARRY